MVLCNKRKLGVLYNPKTGSAALSKLFKTAELDVNIHDHKSNLNGLEDYTFYCFYRDPIERYISGLNYTKRLSDLMIEFLHYFYGERISCAKYIDYNTLSEKHRKMIDNIHPFHYFTEFVKRHNGGEVFSHQITWLNKPNVIPLDYRDFDDQAKFVCSLFDIDVETVPRVNESRSTHKVSDLTDNQIAEIKEFYQADYDYFNDKRIAFS